MASVKKNFIYSSAYQILTMILPLVTSPYVARVLGADGVGINSFTYSIVSYFVLFAKLGLQNYGNRTIATIRDNKTQLNQTFTDLYTLHAIITIVVMFAYWGYVALFGGSYKMLLMLQGGYLIAQLLDINWFFFGIEEFKITVTRNTIIKVLTVICTLLFVKKADDVWIYVLVLVFGSVIGELSVWLNLRKYVSFTKPDISSFGKHFKGLLVFFIPAIAVSFYKVMDKVMLGMMANTAQTGLYENSEKIINICLGLVTALGTVMMPRMTNLIATGKKEASKKLIYQSMDFSYILSFAMCFGLIGVAKEFSIVFWGQEFSSCDHLISGLAISLVFSAAASVIRNQFLIPYGQDRMYIISVCLGAVTNLVINLLCIPKLYALGAVLGTVCAEGIVFAVQMIFTRKDLPHSKMFFKNIWYIMLGIAMCVLCRIIGAYLGPSILTLFLQVFAGGLFYVAGVLLIGLCTKDPTILATAAGMLKKFRRK